MPSFRTLSLGLSLLSAAVAQTSTSCNPTEKTCPADEGLDQSTYTVDFTQGASDSWNVTYGTVTYDGTNGATYTISKSGDAPTMQMNDYIFFGVVSVVMKTAPGTGIVSCAILESDDLDEIDWEWLGGKADEVETNYFGKGNTTTYDREEYINMADTQTDFHNYTIVWTKETLTWMVDGSSVRTLAYADADGGDNYPQTPMRVKLGTWAGGDPRNSEGTIEWAGGETDYDDGPFTAYVKSVSITNYNPASTYTYGDLTGSYSSIELGTSDSSSDSGSTDTTTAVRTGASSAVTSTSSGSSSATSSTSSSGSFSTFSLSPSASAIGGDSSFCSGIWGSAHRNGTSSSTNSTTSTAGSNSTSSSSSSSSSSASSSSSSAASSSSSAASSSSSATSTSGGASSLRGGMLGTSVLLGILGYVLVLA
ncbi:putative glycosidase CRH1 [Cytospora mali]|uniref:Crh-like protein n=1 Tax=Cytospora mali TaxID=578113 RepID=A0A194VKH5_CYTMA|nr:putative glycosidase CRH1 [Valsa mali]